MIFHEDAEAEFRAAITFYEERREGLGTDFQEAVEEISRLDFMRSPPRAIRVIEEEFV